MVGCGEGGGGGGRCFLVRMHVFTSSYSHLLHKLLPELKGQAPARDIHKP